MKGIHFRRVPRKLRGNYVNKIGLFVFVSLACHAVFGIPVDSISILYTVLFADWFWWHHYDQR